MIKGLSAYIKIIASFLIFSAFVEVVLPNTKFRKYIMMVCGLIMISVMIGPVLNFKIDWDEVFDFRMDEEDYSEIAEKYEGIHKELLNEIYDDISSDTAA